MDVCARDGECLPANELRTVHVTWTLHGVVASATSCMSAPDLVVLFYEYGLDRTALVFAPVPCREGKFTVDELPLKYTAVGIRRAGDASDGASGDFDRSGDAALSLPY
jgi:hypothetical protein